MTTGVPAPLVALAVRLLLLSRWSRRTGLRIVVATGAESKRASLRAGVRRGQGEEKSWMPDEDSNLD